MSNNSQDIKEALNNLVVFNEPLPRNIIDMLKQRDREIEDLEYEHEELIEENNRLERLINKLSTLLEENDIPIPFNEA